MPKTAVIVWGTQLSIDHNSALQAEPNAPVIMIESKNISAQFKFHKQKLALVLSAMREFADELRGQGRQVQYIKMDEAENDWFATLEKIVKSKQYTQLIAMRQNDRPPQIALEKWCKQRDIKLSVTPNELFLTPTSQFNEWAEDRNRLQMEMFYRWQRKRLDILMEGNKPAGGKWNYDTENRKPLPKNEKLPEFELPKPSKHVGDVIELIEKEFADHPGSLDTWWLPTTRQQARKWLGDFIDQRFAKFGDYEDAMRAGETFIYHSALSALLNIGLLHPSEVVKAAVDAKNIPLAAREGFIRQIIGWREFMFGLYHYMPADWIDGNYFGHRKKLPDWWWTLKDAPEPPLQDGFERLEKYGYAHHIERLMMYGNYMLISRYSPQEVYKWFMTMFVDAYEWVMVPNVIGMSQFADGGIENGGFATKPYISGSNYLQKMGSWWPSANAARESDWASLYWEFLDKNRDKLENNRRLRPLYSNPKLKR